MITNLPQSDLIYNALLVGMDLKSACLYAGLSESEISELMTDDSKMAYWAGLQKQFEYQLLEKLNTVADKQMNMGKEQALTWLLERVNPQRWGSKPEVDEKLPDINIHLNSDASFGDKTRVEMG